jgi:hypothetical protein
MPASDNQRTPRVKESTVTRKKKEFAMSDKKRFMEAMHRDMQLADDVLLAGLPEVCPVSGNHVRSSMKKMFENVVHALESDTLAGDWGALDYNILPLIRRIFWPEPAFELVSVQPMPMPTGKVFWLDDRYAEAQIDGTPNAITANARMDQYLSRTYGDSAEASGAKKVGLKIVSKTIDVAEKKLSAEWSVEAQQDAKAYLGLDMEEEHTRIISQEARREIGNWILYQLLTYATAGNVNWNTTPPASSDTVNIVAHQKRMWEAIITANNLIFAKKYVNATFIIGGVSAIERLEKSEEYKIVRPEGYDPNQLTYGRHYAGTVNLTSVGPVRIYKDPWFPSTTKMLLGHKGQDWMRTGAFWAPYIAMWFTPLFIDPDDNYNHKKGGLTRYGKLADTNSIVLDGDYYSTVTLTNS